MNQTLPAWISAISLVISSVAVTLAGVNGVLGRLHAREDDKRFARVRNDIAKLRQSDKEVIIRELTKEGQ